jgi:hypothetical protein
MESVGTRRHQLRKLVEGLDEAGLRAQRTFQGFRGSDFSDSLLPRSIERDRSLRRRRTFLRMISTGVDAGISLVGTDKVDGPYAQRRR